MFSNHDDGNHLIRQRPVSMTVNKLIMQETGTFNAAQSRPYIAYVDQSGLENIRDRVSSLAGGKVNGSMLAGIAGGIIAPSPVSQGTINIVNGWNERRIRFTLEIGCKYSTGSDMVYFFQGFTDIPGISMSGHVAPEMVFYINSMIGVMRTVRQTPYGAQTQENVVESAHVLSNNSWESDFQQQNVMIRPEDIFTSLQRADDVMYSDVFDTRSTLYNDAKQSSRSNNIPGAYMAKVIDGYMSSMQSTEFGSTHNEMLGVARYSVIEKEISKNPFLKYISNLKNRGVTNRFVMSDLERLDPATRSVTNYIAPTQNVIRQQHRAGQTEHWLGSNRETIAATLLVNAVPSIMMELLFSSISFRSTNCDSMGNMNTIIAGSQSLTTADLSFNYNLFKRRLEQEVLMDVTFNNQEQYMLEMRVETFGEIWISISLAGGPMIDYCAAAYADSLTAPVLSFNKESSNALVKDFEVILQHTTEETNSPGQKTPGNFNLNI